jgi:hypothetical protein
LVVGDERVDFGGGHGWREMKVIMVKRLFYWAQYTPEKKGWIISC